MSRAGPGGATSASSASQPLAVKAAAQARRWSAGAWVSNAMRSKGDTLARTGATFSSRAASSANQPDL
ncbi:hypothetical protein D3C86_2038360 [compost metagenome]